MRIIQSRIIPSATPWEPNFYGIFWKNGKDTCLIYKDDNEISVLPYSNKQPRRISTYLDGTCLPLPSHWVFAEIDNRPYLMVKPGVVIALHEEQLSYVSEKIQQILAASIRPEHYFETHAFAFDEYCISHRGPCGYRCTRDGKEIWDFIGKAYLYTEIFRWKNRVFFGTAGYGGYFYVLDIDTGEVLIAVKTGGTASIAQKDNICYFFSKSNKRNTSQILCVDLQDVRIVDEIEVHGEVTTESKLQIIGAQIHCVTFVQRNGRCINAIWNIVEM